MQSNLISVLVPFKNTSSFIAECLDSIVKQAFTNWELIIVDDHSTDNSYTIVEGFANKDTRIQLYKNKGQGIIAALQLAYSKSKGVFITRMDSDDIMAEYKIQSMHDDLVSYGKGHIALGLVNYFSEEGINDGYSKYEAWLNTLTKTGANFSEIYKECVIPSPCWMIHRNDLSACDAFNSNRYPEDYDLTFRFYEQNFKCIPCNKVLHHWRDYPTRSSRTHEHYALNYFLNIKIHYFLKLDYNPTRPLTVWGAGFKGKTIAKSLIKKDIPFYWICNNPKKIGKKIYKQKMLQFSYIEKLNNPQSIITVANKKAQIKIKNYMDGLNKQHMNDYFFFC